MVDSEKRAEATYDSPPFTRSSIIDPIAPAFVILEAFATITLPLSAIFDIHVHTVEIILRNTDAKRRPCCVTLMVE